MSAIDDEIKVAILAGDLHPWVEQYSRSANDALVVCAALTYEVAWTIGRHTGACACDPEALLQSVMQTMRQQIAAHHRGRRLH